MPIRSWMPSHFCGFSNCYISCVARRNAKRQILQVILVRRLDWFSTAWFVV